MSQAEDTLVFQLSSLFYRCVSYIFQLTECSKTKPTFADVGPSSTILVGFNFSLINPHLSMKKNYKIEEPVFFIYSKPLNLYFMK